VIKMVDEEDFSFSCHSWVYIHTKQQKLFMICMLCVCRIVTDLNKAPMPVNTHLP
jgi:hypothetical protein